MDGVDVIQRAQGLSANRDCPQPAHAAGGESFFLPFEPLPFFEAAETDVPGPRIKKF